MRQERLYTLVGFFVGGALSLILLSAVFLYDEFVQQRVKTYVMFFKGSLQGLETTSTVAYRGVKIGEVKLIEITANKAKDAIEIPVYVEFFVEKSFGLLNIDPVQILINNGNVASISKPNFLTGVSSIDLIQANQPGQYIKTTYRGYPVFPTMKKAANYMEMDETLKVAKKTFEDISAFISSPDVKETIRSIRAMSNSIDKLAANLDKDRPSVVASLNQSLKQFADAAYSAQNLADYLLRNPEAILRGKK